METTSALACLSPPRAVERGTPCQTARSRSPWSESDAAGGDRTVSGCGSSLACVHDHARIGSGKLKKWHRAAGNEENSRSKIPNVLENSTAARLRYVAANGVVRHVATANLEFDHFPRMMR